MICLRKKPLLSVIVVVYKMPRQALNTLYSLSTAYQREVDATQYEVIVVENSSEAMLHPGTVTGLNGTFRYIRRPCDSVSPVRAVTEGVSRARGGMVAIMIDGARMVTPGIIASTLRARHIAAQPVIAAPSYHIGKCLQQQAVHAGYGEADEEKLLEQIAWQENGYRLFSIACFSGSAARGFFAPNAESNFIAMSRQLYKTRGGCDPRFDLPGGGLVNLDFYKRYVEMADTQLILLPGEGTFHQFHGGVTTSETASGNRDAFIRTIRDQYETLRGQAYAPPRTSALYFGELRPEVMGMVQASARRLIDGEVVSIYPDDDGVGIT
ncbi:MAG: glycosyl transferase [Deltaproteobacteria bacterium]|nr:MAG: glycosyl transferase [Deltaproteobacteria bacterium]